MNNKSFECTGMGKMSRNSWRRNGTKVWKYPRKAKLIISAGIISVDCYRFNQLTIIYNVACKCVILFCRLKAFNESGWVKMDTCKLLPII